MEAPYQKWVNLSYLAVGALAGYGVALLGHQIALSYDLETRIREIELVIRGISVFVGLSFFIGFYKSRKINLFMNEVMVELSRVSWPTQKDTFSATLVVLILVVLSGFILGLFDYLWNRVATSIL